MRWSVYSTIKSHKALIKSWTMKLIGSVILDAAREGATQLAPVSREKKRCKRKYESEKSEESDSGALASGSPRLPFNSVDPKYL